MDLCISLCGEGFVYIHGHVLRELRGIDLSHKHVGLDEARSAAGNVISTSHHLGLVADEAHAHEFLLGNGTDARAVVLQSDFDVLGGDVGKVVSWFGDAVQPQVGLEEARFGVQRREIVADAVAGRVGAPWQHGEGLGAGRVGGGAPCRGGVEGAGGAGGRVSPGEDRGGCCCVIGVVDGRVWSLQDIVCSQDGVSESVVVG